MKPDTDLTALKRAVLCLQQAAQALRKRRANPPISNAKRAPARSKGRAIGWVAAAGCLGLSASTMQPFDVHGEVTLGGWVIVVGRVALAANHAPSACNLPQLRCACLSDSLWPHCAARPRPSVRAQPGRPASTRRGSSTCVR